MELILFWFLFAIAVGIFAGNRGRSGFLWFLLSLFVSPLLTFIFVFVMKDLSEEKQIVIKVESPENKFKSYSHSGEASLNNDSYKIYLTKQYEIEKNDLLNKYVCEEKLFEDIDSAINYAHERELVWINRKEKQKEYDRQQHTLKASYQLGKLYKENQSLVTALIIFGIVILIGMQFR
jgi:hypothetical protein